MIQKGLAVTPPILDVSSLYFPAFEYDRIEPMPLPLGVIDDRALANLLMTALVCVLLF